MNVGGQHFFVKKSRKEKIFLYRTWILTTLIHSLTHTHTHIHSYTFTHALTHMHSHTHTHSLSLSLALCYAHTHTHTLIHIHSHTFTHTHTHSHTLRSHRLRQCHIACFFCQLLVPCRTLIASHSEILFLFNVDLDDAEKHIACKSKITSCRRNKVTVNSEQ